MPKLTLLKPSMRLLSFRTLQLEQHDRASKQRDPHYATPEHVAWSKAVIRDAHGACQRCGRRGTRLFADHIREIKDGGLLYSIANGQALCGSCHTIKSLKEKMKRHGLMQGEGGT